MKEFIRVELTIISSAERGRIKPLSSAAYGGAYRPHIVIGDPNQRRAIVVAKDVHKNCIDESYQGVALWSGPDAEFLPVGEMFEAVLVLIYYPENMYEDVVPGATFTIREGAMVVGFGVIRERWQGE